MIMSGTSPNHSMDGYKIICAPKSRLYFLGVNAPLGPASSEGRLSVCLYVCNTLVFSNAQ